MSDESPHSPAPAYPPSGSREPDWTTGQGIGFLVALPGWIIVPLGVGSSTPMFGQVSRGASSAGSGAFPVQGGEIPHWAELCMSLTRLGARRGVGVSQGFAGSESVGRGVGAAAGARPA